ncbi:MULTISPECIES: alpha/beta hydrolase [Kitasatospora]|uniref:Putative hydrolase n=1 Tax=Kitasatospora setae (strain ATCC 33774 / DSM 43861 / JCM 3304 / KCC A-0304 / NBRC 14216 / KM-6054) TaxID=452652 RepID=E4MZ31_KITSK|nr:MULTISPECIES: alpha/beta hydrolase [Kitasatospora]BAJ25924.1 putative hydrolase [Kitasatospora setae KM-6054]BAJ33354.1 putative hydrolase [Kitasatospora setae KM-6054]
MPTVHAAGTDVHYRTEGTGPGLLLVHGSTADSETNFADLRPRFTARHTVITPDYAGSGLTALPEGPLTLDHLVAQVTAAARAAGADRSAPVDVVGLSLGAVVAAALAARHPHLVRRLVLVGGWARNDDPRQEALLGLWRRLADLDTEAYQQFITLLAVSPAGLAGLDRAALAKAASTAVPSEGARRQIDLDLTVDIRDLLPAIHTPTLVVGATQDQVIPVGHSRELHRAIRGSRYAEIDSGHNIPYERPAELTALITDFLR